MDVHVLTNKNTAIELWTICIGNEGWILGEFVGELCCESCFTYKFDLNCRVDFYDGAWILGELVGELVGELYGEGWFT